MAKWNLALWITSLALQCVLLTVLRLRGTVRRLPFFSVLMAFYIVRSAGLHAASGHLTSSMSELVLNGTSLLEMILQLAVAWELCAGLACLPRTRSLDRIILFLACMLVAAVLAIAIPAVIHANSRAPMDREVLFGSAMFVLIYVARLAARKMKSPVVLVVAGGLACYSIAAICAQVGRTIAAAHHGTAAYQGWSYVSAFVYMSVLVFWIARLPQEKVSAAPLRVQVPVA